MRLSKKGEYALRGLISLAMAHEAGRQLVRIAEIVQRERIPQPFLEQVFMHLREAGVVEAKRGKNGGYALSQPADSITVGQIVRLVEGPLAPIGCVSQTRYQRCSCPDEKHCGLRMLMLDVRNSISAILDRYTLKQVVLVTSRKYQRDGLPQPFTLPFELPPDMGSSEFDI